MEATHVVSGMAKRLDLRTIAEGVERLEQVEYLRDKGVDYVQGWYYSKALTAGELDEFLQGSGV